MSRSKGTSAAGPTTSFSGRATWMGAVIAGVHDLVGWTPIALDFGAAEPWVQWTDLASAAFAEPFFEDTIRKHVDAPGARRVVSEADALPVVGSRCDVVGPSGFVFHGS